MMALRIISLIIGIILCLGLFIDGEPFGLLGIPFILFYFKDRLSATFKRQSKLYKVNEIIKKEREQEIFSQIADELDVGKLDEDLWIKAELKSNGDTKKQKPIYIKLRAERLSDLRWMKEEKEKIEEEENLKNIEFNLVTPKNPVNKEED